MQHNARPWHINYVGLRHTHHHACPQQLPYHFTITVMASNIPDTHQACPSLEKLCESNLANGTEDTLKVGEGGLKLHKTQDHSKVLVLSDANIAEVYLLRLILSLMVDVVKEAEMLADGTMANVRAALSGKAAITRPAKRAI